MNIQYLFMGKKFGLFEDSDLFFAKKLRPLTVASKMRKFKGSYWIISGVFSMFLGLPYM